LHNQIHKKRRILDLLTNKPQIKDNENYFDNEARQIFVVKSISQRL
jgi:hypothetical protein